jgi:hypothetical protein
MSVQLVDEVPIKDETDEWGEMQGKDQYVLVWLYGILDGA